MNKIDTKSIVIGLEILSVLMFSLLITPAKAFATPGYVDNPTPFISSISPNSSNPNQGSIVIAITGNGFIPSSIARVNGSDRMTTFIDYSHILIRLNSNDTRNTDGIYINVFNGFPGGGYSNAELFTINNNNNNSTTITRTTTNTVNNNTDNTYSNTNQNTSQTKNTTTTDSNSSNLAATAIFGSNGFLPSGLIQWILFAIVILLIIILVRKIFGARAKYNESPLKSP
ncbi:MAG: hypothetical protein PHT16_03465 [Candidatus Pacebacteria bacterium]|nr:hypothetical protein [Candidatus Paceibacterota bacterium]